MRARILLLSTITTTVITMTVFVASSASANGGAYVEFEGTHHVPGETPRGIDACGAAGLQATPAFYRDLGLDSIPFRGGIAANTVAGTVSGWSLAL